MSLKELKLLRETKKSEYLNACRLGKYMDVARITVQIQKINRKIWDLETLDKGVEQYRLV